MFCVLFLLVFRLSLSQCMYANEKKQFDIHSFLEIALLPSINMICYSIIIMNWRFVIDIYKRIDDCIEQMSAKLWYWICA